MTKIYALLISLLMILTVAAAGQACCIYNHATLPLKVDGPDVGDWIVHPSNHRCTDGTGGDYFIWVVGPFYKNIMSTTIDISVDDHGWISVFRKEDGKWKVESKDKHGKVKHTEYMKELSSPKK